jgi:hypothetical protein
MAGVKPWANGSQADHSSEVNDMGDSLEDAICRKSYIVERDLAPSKPQNTKKAEI